MSVLRTHDPSRVPRAPIREEDHEGEAKASRTEACPALPASAEADACPPCHLSHFCGSCYGCQPYKPRKDFTSREAENMTTKKPSPSTCSTSRPGGMTGHRHVQTGQKTRAADAACRNRRSALFFVPLQALRTARTKRNISKLVFCSVGSLVSRFLSYYT
ncbi:hypothetical protein BDP81DRAFT_422036 [Colletotrichum phormii]|uniref:Uncharacterized protein n=1 Tax=Colletotrichum phormii TaxID=359342 RepID=A0AAI9ZX94_9PEZI|nr:uncharacterized protein BDP81DRAFT_422036 [Colletotrichum phormii]KAK1639905.1 hypothetical protein BDP81DRAFT_422036 [Colletotrichum phormii]